MLLIHSCYKQMVLCFLFTVLLRKWAPPVTILKYAFIPSKAKFVGLHKTVPDMFIDPKMHENTNDKCKLCKTLFVPAFEIFWMIGLALKVGLTDHLGHFVSMGVP